ncbi:MAG: NAD(P)/FAD-dependent oxidoreductase [Bacilli bacterium]|nr:NAD(P)/FAD-dependent oxidoreductase [Bacilli bacterium]
MKNYDVIFVGSGHACWHGALILKTLGKSVALVEKDLLGGTCTNYGCDAKILLDSPFELKEGLDRYKGIGLAQEAKLDWKSLMAYKKQVIGGMQPALGGMFDKMGFDVIKGSARFLDKNTIEVEGEKYGAKNFVIGTGQTYIPLDIPGKEYFHDSRQFLSLDEIPEHVTFVGAGIISMEFASLCLSLGKKVEIITIDNLTLNQYPLEYTNLIVRKMEAQGAKFHFQTEVSELRKVDEGNYVVVTKDGTEIKTNYVLVAVGRKANVYDMNLEGIGVKASDRGIAVDEHLRTTVKNIYASGDVIDKRIPKLTPTAEFESNYIALDILLPINRKIAYPAIPNLVFTLPRIGQVGVSVKEADANKDTYRVERVPIGQTMAWGNKNQLEESIIFIFDKRNYLVGAAVYSDDAGSYLDILTLIINERIGARKLSKMIFSFPTQTYGVISMLLASMLKK